MRSHLFGSLLKPCFLKSPKLTATAGRRRTASSSSSQVTTVFSGIQPSGSLHLGNYIGLVQPWLQLQNSCGPNHDLILCIVDLHSMTMPQNRCQLSTRITDLTASLLACGVDPDRVTLFLQSHVPEHAQLSWLLGCLTTMPRLAHLPQYRDKSASLKNVPLGVFVYPVLQAADILLYRAHQVPVGEDQVQHIQLAQHLAERFNSAFNTSIFPKPSAIVNDDVTARVKSLRDPLKKMSKSDPDTMSCVYLTDSAEEVHRKVKKAVTDFTSEVFFDIAERPAVSNLMQIHSALTGLSLEEIRAQSRHLDTGAYKPLLAQAISQHLQPVQERWRHLRARPQHLRDVLEHGRRKAATRARDTWQHVVEATQLRLSD